MAELTLSYRVIYQPLGAFAAALGAEWQPTPFWEGGTRLGASGLTPPPT